MDLHPVGIRRGEDPLVAFVDERTIPLDTEDASIGGNRRRGWFGRLRAACVVDDEPAIITQAKTTNTVAVAIGDVELPAVKGG